MTFYLWCDGCYEKISDFKIGNNSTIECAQCGNTVIWSVSETQDKRKRIELAKAIWHLS